jgi:hypothetical protein
MDTAQVFQLVTIGACIYVAARTAIRPLDQAEAVFASLFVPPDRTLGWPRGVQESDAPWGWRPPIDAIAADPTDPTPIADLPAEPSAEVLTGHSTYVEHPHRVDPVRIRTLPQ